MPLSSSALVSVRYAKETVFGVVPTTGNSTNLRVTGESFNFGITKESSDEINADRAPTSMIPVDGEATGAVNFELSYAEFDPLIAGVLQSTYTVFGTNGVGVAFSATITATTITASAATTGTSAFTNLKAGQWFKLTGTASANDNKLFRVSKTTAPTATVITLDTGTPGVVGGPYAATVLSTSRISNGTAQPSYSIERVVGDVGEYFVYRGMTPGSMSLDIASGAKTTGEISFTGKDSLQKNTTFMPGTAVASKTYDIMSGVSGTMCALWADGVPLSNTFVSSIKFSYDNSLRSSKAICSLGAIGIGSGSINLTVDLEVFFAAGANFYSQFEKNNNIELCFTSFDNLGNGYVFTLPKANVSTYTTNASDKDSDFMAQIQVMALLDNGNADAALRKVLFIDRMGAAVIP